MKPEQGIRFLRQFQELLAEGGFVATYKFALMQALADLSVEHQAAHDGSLRLHVDQLAEKFIEYYWNQARPFNDRVLRQNTKGQAEVLLRIQDYRSLSDGKLGQLQADRAAWQKLIRRIAAIIVKMPLWRLQIVGNRKNEFLYREAEYRDRSIRLLPGVPDAFRAFHPMLTSMIRGGWMSQIHRIRANQEVLGAKAELEGFLFGTDRRSLERFTAVIRAHQSRECFYCGKRVTGSGDLDHFIPWSRYPLDLGHNFVYAHKGCNNAKRDHLAAVTHLERWRIQNLDEGHSLAEAFEREGLSSDLERSVLIARWAYEQGCASGARLWIRGGEFEDCDYRWKSALAAPSALRLAAEDTSPRYES
jgi:5-methylcytosine-specific restriction endonuclease McrA